MNDCLFLDLPKDQQRDILSNFKKDLNLNWNQVANLLKVNRSMVFLYCNDTCKMPFRRLEALCKKTNRSLNKFSGLTLKKMPHCIEKIILVPKRNEKLAEFIGILSGDGCIVNQGYATYITCDAIMDKSYVINEVKPLFTSLFGINPKLRVLRNEIYCMVYSKNLFNFLSNDCSFPIGKKKNRLKIPDWIVCNKKFSAAFLRGLFDTDGGFHRHHKKCAQAEYTSHSPNFLREVYELLKGLDLNPRIGKEQVWILQKEKIDLFFEIVNPRNKKHQFKYKKFKETGCVPLSREIRCGCRESNPGLDLGKVGA